MLDLSIKELFFDRQRVIDAAGRGRVRALNRIGGFLRTVARRSMRKRPGASPPGKPPHSHVGLLRDGIFYGYDRGQDSVVVGPALLRTRGRDGVPVSGTVPQVLEQGGKVRRERRGGQEEIVNVQARPLMGPALETGRKSDKLSQAWKDVVR